jgi:hypothetical protein
MHRSAAALLVVLAASSMALPARGVGVSPGVASAVQRDQAQALFQRAKKLYDAKNYAESLTQFRAAMDIVASPNARLYVARCLREMGKLVEAYVEFDRTAVEATEHAREDSRYARTGPSARTERDALAAKLGFVRIHVVHPNDSEKLTVAGEEIQRAGWSEPVPVMPGDVEIRLMGGASPPITRTVTIAAGEKRSVDLDAAPAAVAVVDANAPTEGRAGLRPYAYVAAGIGAAGLLTFAISGILSDVTYGDLGSQCGSGPCPASKQSEVSRGQTEQTVADVGLAFGLAGLAGGVTLFVLSLPHKKEKGAEPDVTAPPAPNAEVSFVPGGLSVQGRF